MKWLIKHVFLIFIIVLAVFTLWYHIPYSVNKTIKLSNLDGKSTTVKFDVSWHKFFFKPTELRGKIIINDHVYRTKSRDLTSLLEKLKLKISNKKYIPAFLRDSDPNSNYVATELAFLFVTDLNLDKVCLNIKDKDTNSIDYYGPAETIQEAKLLSENIFKEIINY